MTSPKIDPYQLFADKHNIDTHEVLTTINFDNNHPLHAELQDWVSNCKSETLTVENFKALRKKVDEQDTELRELRSCMLQIRRAINATFDPF